ncbi:MAG: metal-binding protein [Oscillatoriales cyanobacterium]|nr:MAG: metal-binding protein [Oscillatoriales cyanobacterium]
MERSNRSKGSHREIAEAERSPQRGRLVWNHSTHLDGLIPILERLTQVRGIRTITPAVLSNGRSNSPHLQLKVSVPVRGGYKLIARKGKTIQEVFVVTQLTQESLEGAIAQVMDKS